ncbi:hypothetical protein CDG81_06105 [Actinopolyspora erythraea]|uniref:Uncharacterized protein n=1 Tax=Actinopolyspora erythraea TaxID=414996 RepID=A0A099D1L8_9ACTN|nr:hypothetical protein CDG81_06105 [Actinopolyspora erythraea]KGI79712.1 hypothetical protein IL38_21125 [Actinopolyspora erythraea]
MRLQPKLGGAVWVVLSLRRANHTIDRILREELDQDRSEDSAESESSLFGITLPVSRAQR